MFRFSSHCDVEVTQATCVACLNPGPLTDPPSPQESVRDDPKVSLSLPRRLRGHHTSAAPTREGQGLPRTPPPHLRERRHLSIQSFSPPRGAWKSFAVVSALGIEDTPIREMETCPGIYLPVELLRAYCRRACYSSVLYSVCAVKDDNLDDPPSQSLLLPFPRLVSLPPPGAPLCCPPPPCPPFPSSPAPPPARHRGSRRKQARVVRRRCLVMPLLGRSRS